MQKRATSHFDNNQHIGKQLKQQVYKCCDPRGTKAAYCKTSCIASPQACTAEMGLVPESGEQEPEEWCKAWLARLAASEGRRMWPAAARQWGSSRMQGGCCPKEDHLRGEAAAEGRVLEGVLDPLSASLPIPQTSQTMERVDTACQLHRQVRLWKE